jgi:hypothetical protein
METEPDPDKEGTDQLAPCGGLSSADLLAEVADFTAAAVAAVTMADFDVAKAKLRKIRKCLEKMERDAARCRIKTEVERKKGRTDRHEMVARKVLLEGLDLKVAGKLIGVTGPRARQLLHEFCRGRNREVFDFEFHRSPTLKQLRDNAAKFFG